MLSLTPTLYKYVNTSGWLTENITTDSLQKTADGQYEYQVELINLFQRNSYARLYLKNVNTAEETRIPVDLAVNEIKGLSVGKVNYWVSIELNPVSDNYLMITTTDFPLPGEEYEIDVPNGTAVRMK
ncbi:hypothetical protein [Paenibacillus mendelii]|uniref:Uncharacterized protein n=1 Tax=Paenibacillus mendelii TaxID=206163 RepID=A0ABV6JFX8_9BACL|nr:hypothetical protein [Paenibacillus mendelii]